MDEQRPYVEEAFGIITDDDIYLDCILLKPRELIDEELSALRVWVPRYPLTKSSVITCARQEVQAHGSESTIAHMVFDLRGTGHSEGQPDDENFEMDLEGIRLWAEERFGDEINFGFLGTPQGEEQVDVRPIRPGVVMETYHYRPSEESERPPVIYLATYGNFSPADNARCRDLAQAGYEVFGMDPLRYLLHASTRERLTANQLWQDMHAFGQRLPAPPLLVGMPVAAGLALMWASGVAEIAGVIAIGRAQMAFKPGHIFKNDTPHTFFLSRYVHKIPPRPVVFVRQEGHSLGGNRDELSALYETCSGRRRLEKVAAIRPEFLLEQLAWLQESE